MSAPPSYEEAVSMNNPVVRMMFPGISNLLPRAQTAPPAYQNNAVAGTNAPSGDGTQPDPEVGYLEDGADNQMSQEKEEDNPYANLCCSLIFFIVYLVGYFKDDAAKNVRDNPYTSECTNFPDIFFVYFIAYGATNALALYNYHAKNNGQNTEIGQCLFGLTSLFSIVFMIYVVERYFALEDDCKEAIKVVGSDLFWTCIEMLSILCLIYLCLVALGCCCVCCACVLLASGKAGAMED